MSLPRFTEHPSRLAAFYRSSVLLKYTLVSVDAEDVLQTVAWRYENTKDSQAIHKHQIIKQPTESYSEDTFVALV